MDGGETRPPGRIPEAVSDADVRSRVVLSARHRSLLLRINGVRGLGPCAELVWNA